MVTNLVYHTWLPSNALYSMSGSSSLHGGDGEGVRRNVPGSCTPPNYPNNEKGTNGSRSEGEREHANGLQEKGLAGVGRGKGGGVSWERKREKDKMGGFERGESLF